MLISASDAPADGPLRTTVCVVGSGPSGLMLTRRLVESGIDVLVLEAGPLKGRPSEDELALPVEYLGQAKKLAPTIAQQVGGTSSLWRGALGPLDAIDFQIRRWIPESGWPLDAEDLAPFYCDAANYFNVADPTLFRADALPDSLRALLDEMPFDRAVLENKLFQQPLPPKRFVDDARGYLARSSQAKLVYDARVVELLSTDDGSNVTQVLFLTPDGARRSAEAEYVVLCGGAYQNPRLLLNSRSRWADGIGNHKGLVGRYLADHPMGNLFQVRLRQPMKAHIYADLMLRPGQRLRSALRLTDARQELQGLPNHAFYLRPSFAEGIDDRKEEVRRRLLALRGGKISPRDLWYVATSVDLITQIMAYRFSLRTSYQIASVLLVCEQIPNPESRVTLSNTVGADGYPIARADWRLLEADFESIGALYDTLVKEGLDPRFFTPVQGRDDLAWRDQLSSAAHHLGTCRMAQSPSNGVVDRDLKVFGVNNLYVCDGSVFPTTGNANSTLTAAALARRLGAHLAHALDRAGPPPTVPPDDRRARIALTGASGFIGQNFMARHAGNVAELRALGRTSVPLPQADNVSAHLPPLNDASALAQALEGCDALVHLAYQHGDPKWNLSVLRNLVEAAHRANVRRVVHVSTISVYDQSHVGLLVEQDDHARTHDEYSVVKRQLETEFATLVSERGLQGVILQPTIVYGWPGNWTGSAADVAKRERALLPEGGRGLCNAVHVDDVAAAIFLAATASNESLAEGEAPCFLVSGPEAVTWTQFYTQHAAMLRRLGLPEQLKIETLTSARPYHNDRKRDLILHALYEGHTGKLAQPLIGLAKRRLRRNPGSPNRARAALTRLSAPLREGAWVPTGLARTILRVRYRVDSGRARRILGYYPKLGLEDGIDATEQAIRHATKPSTPNCDG